MTKPLNRPSSCGGDDIGEIPRPDGVLDRLEQRVLPDALRAAEHEGVVDLLLRLLHAVREPLRDVVGIVRIDVLHELEPACRLSAIARLDGRRQVQIEDVGTVSLDPAPFVIRRSLMIIGSPGAHVICSTAAIGVEPCTGLDENRLIRFSVDADLDRRDA